MIAHSSAAGAGPLTGLGDRDLGACGREPIHSPGSIQPHGHLLALEGDGLALVHASAAAFGAVLPDDPKAALGAPLERALCVEPLGKLCEGLRRLPEQGLLQLGPCQSRAGGDAFQALAHRSPDGLAVLELEAATPGLADHAASTLEELYPLVRDAFDRLGAATGVGEITAVAAREVRRLTGFDRVLVYRFEESWDGVVVAEDRNGRLPSYLDLRFPASDIPFQARRLYTTNRLRLIVDAGYAAVPILPDRHPRTGRPLDLSFSALRSVSPVHLEYMRNMGTAASMSVSLLREDRLWGLISCHHAEPRRVALAVRAGCDLIGQMLAVRITAKEEAAHAEERARLKGIEGRLLAHMAAARGRFAEGLTAAPAELCALTDAAGAAVLTQDGCALVGRTPREADVRRLAEWLWARGVEETVATHALADMFPDASEFSDVASGVLAAPVSRLYPSFVFWFRPEIVRTVRWGGDPRKPVVAASSGASGPGRLSPRRSFDAWKETVRGTASPWSPAQVEAARELRSAIVGVVLRQAEERAELSGRLERINTELAAFSYSVSHDLRAPFRHIVGYAELLMEREGKRLDETSRRFVATIIQSAQTAGRLVDGLLNFSRMGRTSLTIVETDTGALVREVIATLSPETEGRRLAWRIAELPVVRADPVMLQQVFQNLLSNAVKYTRHRAEAVINVGCEAGASEFVFCVRDNGAGFDMAYAHKLFGVFQRLHRIEEYEGIGIGLANVRRIVERHGGRTWAEGELGRGAAFYFTLPRAEPPPEGQ